MSTDTNKLEEMKVFKCPDCGGDGKRVADWDAFNQCSPYSIMTPERRAYYSKIAFGDCHRCKGKGFLLESKEGK